MPEHTIAENLTRLRNAKTAIGNAITAKGGTVAASDGLEEFAADIAAITNQYTAGDEGKVVSGGQLVAQTSTTVTENGTYDTTLNNSVTVNVDTSGSGLVLSTVNCKPSTTKFKSEKWVSKTWSGYTSINGRFIWTDGENIYYSKDTIQYILDKSTSTWSTKTWSGITRFSGESIWTDGENIYYSAGSSQYALDKSTSTWTAKTWSGYTNIDGNSVWTDGENIYYSGGSWSTQYVLDKQVYNASISTHTPSART